MLLRDYSQQSGPGVGTLNNTREGLLPRFMCANSRPGAPSTVSPPCRRHRKCAGRISPRRGGLRDVDLAPLARRSTASLRGRRPYAAFLFRSAAQALVETDRLEVRIVADTSYTRFVDDEFDADIVYGASPSHLYGTSGQQGVVVLPLGTEVVIPFRAPELAAGIRTAQSLLSETLIESEVKKVRGPAWFKANGLLAPESHGPRFDRSFLSLSAAADGLGIALESTLLAEHELASGRLVRPLEGICEDITNTGHWLVFPRAKRYSKSIVVLSSGWRKNSR